MKASTIAKIAERKNVGDILNFGRYRVPSSGKPYDYGAEIYKPMEWYVLAKEDTRMLLLSRECVDWDFIDGTGRSQTWDHCYARKDLLPAIYSACFTKEEKRMIMPVKLHTAENPVSGTRGGRDTLDLLFFLSIEEFQKYVFPEAAPARLYLLDKMDIFDPEKENIYEMNYENTTWWLRSPGGKQNCFAVVNRLGELETDGLENDLDEIGIRPAVWIDLNALFDDDLPF